MKREASWTCCINDALMKHTQAEDHYIQTCKRTAETELRKIEGELRQPLACRFRQTISKEPATQQPLFS